MPGFKFVPYNDIKAVEKAITKETCAVLLEAVQGEGGVIPADKTYLQKLRALCDKKGILMLFDEVQCGFGRTGKLFGWMHGDIIPDAFSMAKAIANGFPMGALLISPKFTPIFGQLGTTFGGNHLACSAAQAVLDVIEDENLLENVNKVGDFLMTELKKIPAIKEVRGKGLMIGI
jgi:acetylornithine aminotransferase